MRIIHTSDWHLGQYFYGKSRANEHQQFLNWLLAQVSSEHIDAIIVAGDIFDTATPPSYARQMYYNFISDLQAYNCQLIVLAGNHDSVSMLAESKALLSSLSTHVIANVTDIDDEAELAEQVFVLNNKQGTPKAVICAVPFIRPRDIVKSKAGQSATDKSNNLQQAIVQHYQALFEQAQQLVANSQLALPIIATGHLTALGVTSSDSVRDIYIGTLEALPSNAFPAADYIALGHIHRSQRVGKTEHIRYCGSPIPLSFDEATHKKRVLVVEFNDGTLAGTQDLLIPCFQPLAMVKTSYEQLEQKITSLITELHREQTQQGLNKDNSEQKLWLDIELLDSGILSDIQPKITAIVKDLPVEVLLVRRAKQVRKALMQAHQADKSTLSELTLDDVFSSRINQEPSLQASDDDPEQQALLLTRKENLHTLFKQTAAQVFEQEHSQLPGLPHQKANDDINCAEEVKA